ncbi:hypothetical protein H3S91_03805 [Gilliamella sp. B14448G7]|nr:hypothetical protein [Gilliamella sp. B14448G7]
MTKHYLSNNEQKYLNTFMKKIPGRCTEAVINLKKTKKASFEEVYFLVRIMTIFDYISLVEEKGNTRNDIRFKTFYKGHAVYIRPHYKVENINPKSQDWSIDFVLTIHRIINNKEIFIDSLGIEYDGHPSHFTPDRLLSDRKRDIQILIKEHVNLLRITKDIVTESFIEIEKAIFSFFDRKISIIDEVQSKTLSYVNSLEDIPTLTTCQLCNGIGRLNFQDCPICHNMGSTPENQKIELSEFEIFTCGKCGGITSNDCEFCAGEGKVTREIALSMT